MADKTICNGESVCFDGECTGSICLAYNLDPCQCSPTIAGDFYDEVLCKACCMTPGDDASCAPSDEWNTPPYDVPDLMAKSGGPCNNYLGYCDVFHKCREVDPAGPLSNLKMLFSAQGLEDIKKWVTDYWYVVLLGMLGLVIFMALFIKLCSPKKRKKSNEVRPSKGHPAGTRRRPPPRGPPGSGPPPWARRPPPGARPPPGSRPPPPGSRPPPPGSRPPPPGAQAPPLGSKAPPPGSRPPPPGNRGPPTGAGKKKMPPTGRSPPPAYPGLPRRAPPMDDGWV